MNIIYKPTKGPECWKGFLAKPQLHWKSGRSAKSMAYAWEHYRGLPERIAVALSSISEDIEPLIVIPEYKVALPGGGRKSQNDAFLLSRLGERTACIMIEGKVSEPFGPDLKTWLEPQTKNKMIRLDGLTQILCLEAKPPEHIRYQLLHRTASALITAQKFKTHLAIMLVHSFSQKHEWFDDFKHFAALMQTSNTPKIGAIEKVGTKTDIPLYIGWVNGEKRFLKK